MRFPMLSVRKEDGIILSILFMRFYCIGVRACRGEMNFQFSLWDSERRTYPWWDKHRQLSILFMRFVKIFVTDANNIFSTFNSLYEILMLCDRVILILPHDFQFSLWDSVWVILFYWLKALLSFNSLYEIRISSNLVSLVHIIAFNSLYEIRWICRN